MTNIPTTIEAREKIKKVKSGCWEWTGSISGGGYGSLSINGRSFRAHRVFYELYKGKIPKDLQIDHLCRNRKCVNPKHLEAVTQKENIARGIGAPAINMRKTKCSKCGGDYSLTICRIYARIHRSLR